MFQSSPVPEDGCNAHRRTGLLPAGWFQSSPVPEDGCNMPSGTTEDVEIVCFNPHPSRRTGATWQGGRSSERSRLFQSSPVPEDGCNAIAILPEEWLIQVSILTRPGGRVQPPAARS